VTRRLLTLVSMVLLAAVTMVSAARVICLLPCFTVPTAEATTHCAHSTSNEAPRLSEQPGTCGDCEQVSLENADRLPSRHVVIGPHAVATVTSLQPAPAVQMSGVAPALPRGLSPGRAPVPLRI
jgi:hypothetical protein